MTQKKDTKKITDMDDPNGGDTEETIEDFDEQTDDDDAPDREATLAERVLWLRDHVGYVQKDKSVGGKYAAVSHDKITAYLRSKMVQAGIFHWVTCVESTDHETGQVIDNGRRIMQNRATFEVTFENAFNADDKRTCRVVAHADDYGDKSPGKTLSYATKYALLKISMIETGEEDEERTADDAGARVGKIEDDETMLNDLWAVADELFGDDAARTLKAMAARRFFVESYGAIPQDRFDDALRALRVSHKQLQESKARAGTDDEGETA
jgi:hypothetical protein